MDARMKRLLLLDLDGTVVDTLGFIITCFQQSVADLLVRVPTSEEVVATFGPAEVDCIAQLLRSFELQGLVHQPVQEQHIQQAASLFHQLYASGYASGAVQAYPHMVELVQEARQHGWATAVFTGKGRTSALATLEHLYLLPHFDAVISSDDVVHPKPAPDGVLLACELTQTLPARTIFIGDNPADILAGRGAGAFTAAALWGAFDRTATLAASAHWNFESPSDLRLHLQHVMIVD